MGVMLEGALEEEAGASAVGETCSVHGATCSWLGIEAIVKETGISRSTAKRWHRGDKGIKEGRIAGFTPPLDRLGARA